MGSAPGIGPFGGDVGLLDPEGVPGLTSPLPLALRSPSLFLVVGVPREDEDRLDNGLLSPPDEAPPETKKVWILTKNWVETLYFCTRQDLN